MSQEGLKSSHCGGAGSGWLEAELFRSRETGRQRLEREFLFDSQKGDRP
ncbi:hypothetical protein ACVS9P_08495 [Caproicibacterium sp. NSD3]